MRRPKQRHFHPNLRNLWSIAVLSAVAVVCCSGSGALAKGDEGESVDVFAAASLKTALDTLAEEYASVSDVHMRVTYAGSSTLARQIIHGAPADIFISANEAWMDELEEAGRLQPDSRKTLLTNSLVVIAHDDGRGTASEALDLSLAGAVKDRLGEGVLATALVDAVPAGIYAKAAMQSLGHWDTIAAQVAQADNVRAALALVSTGAAPLGIVYATDATAGRNISVIAEIPQDSHPPIRYPVALIEGATPAAAQVFSFLTSPQARSVFEALGFGWSGDSVQ